MQALVLAKHCRIKRARGLIYFAASDGQLTGIPHVSDRTVRRLLNRKGYLFLQARKKGLMSETEKAKRVEFARIDASNIIHRLVWTDNLAFYLDGVSFVYKTNPMDQARAPKGSCGEKKSEGLKQGCFFFFFFFFFHTSHIATLRKTLNVVSVYKTLKYTLFTFVSYY